jgi:hypothetical protein
METLTSFNSFYRTQNVVALQTSASVQLYLEHGGVTDVNSSLGRFSIDCILCNNEKRELSKGKQ